MPVKRDDKWHIECLRAEVEREVREGAFHEALDEVIRSTGHVLVGGPVFVWRRKAPECAAIVRADRAGETNL